MPNTVDSFINEDGKIPNSHTVVKAKKVSSKKENKKISVAVLEYDDGHTEEVELCLD